MKDNIAFVLYFLSVSMALAQEPVKQQSEACRFSDQEKAIFCSSVQPFLKDVWWFAKCPRNSVPTNTIFIQDTYGRTIAIHNGFAFTIPCQHNGITRVDLQRKKCDEQSPQEEECVEISIVEQRLDFAPEKSWVSSKNLNLVATWQPQVTAVFTIKDFEQLLIDCAHCKKLESGDIVSYVSGSHVPRDLCV